MIVQEPFEINGIAFVRTYSDAGRYVVGGNPRGVYAEATDPASENRTYVEGDVMPADETTAEEVLDILLGGDGE